MIVAPSGFCEVQMEGVFWRTFELSEPQLRYAPQAFDTIDIDASVREFILRMIDAKVPVAQIHQPIISAPSIAVDYSLRVDATTNYPLQRCV